MVDPSSSAGDTGHEHRRPANGSTTAVHHFGIYWRACILTNDDSNLAPQLPIHRERSACDAEIDNSSQKWNLVTKKLGLQKMTGPTKVVSQPGLDCPAAANRGLSWKRRAQELKNLKVAGYIRLRALPMV